MSDSVLRKPIIEKNRIVRLRAYARNRPKSTTPSSDDLVSLNESLKLQLANPNQDRNSPEYLNQLIRRLLYPTVDCYNFRDYLPSLTSSNKVDLYLYPVIGLLLKNFVHGWYKNITDDTQFIEQILIVISQITRDLEKRLGELDLLELLLDDIPLILDNHLRMYRKVIGELGSVFLPYDMIDSAFDHLESHKALTDDPDDEVLYLRVLAGQLLKILLPDTERDSSLTFSFLNTLVSDLLLRITTEKLAQPYQLFEVITKICQAILNEKEEDTNTNSNDKPIEKQDSPTQVQKQPDASFTGFFYKVLSKVSHFIAHSTSLNFIKKSHSHEPISISSLYVFEFLNNLFQLYKHRPVLYSTLASLNIILRTPNVNHFLTNIISNTLVKSLSSESLIILILKSARSNLFPQDDAMGPARIDPDLEEYEQIRTTTKTALYKVALKYKLFTKVVICNDLEVDLDNILEDFLTSLENKRLNKHLVYRLLDLIILRLVPEMGSDH
ncbi:hypothetical protein WICPIJ_004053 [Wickerhamomyces pijperi]|uniref:PXA domain-containing protein n=1 Tax=Wickerhamomyces pijperi TaxID=599730 RepID=A0A9P8Q8T7_WICPI|nr:hypothetical protein WICPIJ_004053 [Wickerhamomyces pijperi]